MNPQSAGSSPDGDLTIARHLVTRLREYDVSTAFGIVGDYAIRFFDALDTLGFPVLVTTDEASAAFAADAYARLRGLGVVAVTYGAGALKVANAAANAWAEQVPLLVISGAPGIRERAGNPQLHHKVKDFDSQLRIFRELTCAQAVLGEPANAANEIDRVVSTMLDVQRPGYLEIPRDAVASAIAAPTHGMTHDLPEVDAASLRHAVEDIVDMLRSARSAAIHAGSLIARRHLSRELFALAEEAHLPVATSSLARGVFPERHELGLGMYLGAVSPPRTNTVLETADVVLSIGVLQTDLTLGAFTASLDHERLILCTDTDVTVGYRTYRQAPLWALLPAVTAAVGDAGIRMKSDQHPHHPSFSPDDVPLSVERVIAAIDARLDERHGLLLDPGEALFASVDLRAPTWALGSAYYATMGYALPAALGAWKADPDRRPVVVLGDGAFAMSGMEVGGLAFHGVPAIVIVLDNAGYGTQRPIIDGPFNDIPSLAAEHMVDVVQSGSGTVVRTEREFDVALQRAIDDSALAVIRVVLPRDSRSAGLSRLGAALAARA